MSVHLLPRDLGESRIKASKTAATVHQFVAPSSKPQEEPTQQWVSAQRGVAYD
jgi:hypothetical protein